LVRFKSHVPARGRQYALTFPSDGQWQLLTVLITRVITWRVTVGAKGHYELFLSYGQKADVNRSVLNQGCVGNTNRPFETSRGFVHTIMPFQSRGRTLANLTHFHA
jgi:hypothetical protein